MLFGKKYNEYKPEKLPTSRREQFFDLLTHNYLLLLFLGFVFLFTFLPMFICIFIRDFYFASYMAMYQREEITQEQLVSLTTSLLHTMNIIISSSFIFTSISFAGVSKIYRHLIWTEPIFLFRDFLKGIKENIVKILLFDLVIIASIYGLYSLNMIPIDIWIVKYLPFAIFACIVIAVYLHFILQINIYNQKGLMLVKNCFAVYFRSPLITLLFVALLFLVILLANIINVILIKFIVFCALTLFLLPIYLLIWFLLDINILDKCVNKELFKEVYRKGLHEETTNEES